MSLRRPDGGRLRAAVPLALLLLQVLLVFGSLPHAGRLRPRKVADTQSYLVAASSTTLTQALAHYRTQGYPLFLKMAARMESRLGMVPTLQAVLYLSAVLLFWLAIWRYTDSRWLALAAATPLPYAHIFGLVNILQPDLLAAAAALAAVSFLLLLERRPASVVLWAAFTLALFTSYQLRPANVFLVVLAPVIAAILRWSGAPLPWRSVLRWAGFVALAAALPYLAFATLRWVKVGHFGLVSFGGTNLSAAAACFLDHDLVRELPEDSRLAARKALAARRRAGFQPLRRGDDTAKWFEEQYNENLWRIMRPGARALLDRERRRAREATAVGEEPPRLDPRPDQVVINARLGELSEQIILRRPGLYLQWVRDSFGFGLRQLGDRPWVFWPATLIVLALPVSWVIGARSRRTDGGGRSDVRPFGLFLVGVLYFVANLLLLALVTFPFARYFAGAVLLLPSVLCVELFELGRKTRAASAT
jgi:hypothetical protein